MSQSPEVIILDQFVKTIVIQLGTLSSKLGIELEKSKELTSNWHYLKIKLDKYI